jgi:hypothetical protein
MVDRQSPEHLFFGDQDDSDIVESPPHRSFFEQLASRRTKPTTSQGVTWQHFLGVNLVLAFEMERDSLPILTVIVELEGSAVHIVLHCFL